MKQLNLRFRRASPYVAPGLSRMRPEDFHEYLQWEDAWLSAILDLAIKTSNRNLEAFTVAAAIVYAGALAGYDG